MLICSGERDAMNWFSAKAECETYGMTMLRISGAVKVQEKEINYVNQSWFYKFLKDKQPIQFSPVFSIDQKFDRHSSQDEWLNSYLADSHLFEKPDQGATGIQGIWIGASETTNSSKEFAWYDGMVIGDPAEGSNSAYNSINTKFSQYNSKVQVIV